MCRTIVIHCDWDDDDISPGIFNPAKNYNEFTEFAEDILWKELTSMFNGQITIEIREREQ